AHLRELLCTPERQELPQHKKSMLGRVLFYVAPDPATGSETFCNAAVWLNPRRNNIELRGNGNRRPVHRAPSAVRKLRPPASGPHHMVFLWEITTFRTGVPRSRFDPT